MGGGGPLGTVTSSAHLRGKLGVQGGATEGVRILGWERVLLEEPRYLS